MSTTRTVDKRLIERRVSRGNVPPAELEAFLRDLPDLAENVRPVSEEELEELRASLPRERAARRERIEHFLREPKEVVPPPAPIIPIDSE